MPYVSVWSDFVEQAAALYAASPSRTRYTWKYRVADNEIVLKVTDDHRVVQYRCAQSAELKLVEQWNLVFMKLATSKAQNPPPNVHQILHEIEEERKAEQAAAAEAGAKKKGGAGKQKK
jgi:hypothetical protein